MAEGNPRARSWVFTVNNWTPEQYDMLMAMECRYMIIGKEMGDQGVPHLQGYVVFRNQVYHRTLNGRLRCYWAVALGDPDDNYAYCTKGGDFHERGEKPMSRQAAREKGGRFESNF